MLSKCSFSGIIFLRKEVKKHMYLTIKQQAKLSKENEDDLRTLCHLAKNLYNEALYAVRQHFFNTGKYLNYYDVYKELKSSENYRLLNSNLAQQILKEVDGTFHSFFSLLKMKSEGKYDAKVRIPRYLDKEGFTTLVIGFVRINGNKFVIPYSNSFRKEHKRIEISIPPQLMDKLIKEIRIIPKQNGRFFEFQYTYESERIEVIKPDFGKALSIDTGVNNFCSCITSEGKSFIIDGKYIKSVNQWYNKNNARLSGIKDKQKNKGTTKQQSCLERRRNNQINDYISKSARYIINYCIENHIGNIVFGYNKDIQKNSNIGKANNQSFVNIPFGKLRSKLTYLSEMYGIKLILQEESYTSKASFFDNDAIPVYSKDDKTEYIFSGRRIKRGLYETSHKKLINADINGALNILRKSSAVDLSVLSSRGAVDTPLRIRLA